MNKPTELGHNQLRAVRLFYESPTVTVIIDKDSPSRKIRRLARSLVRRGLIREVSPNVFSLTGIGLTLGRHLTFNHTGMI